MPWKVLLNKCFTRVGSHKYKIGVEVTDCDKRSSLLQYGINYDRKKLHQKGLHSGGLSQILH